jgi:hypothetical protein
MFHSMPLPVFKKQIIAFAVFVSLVLFSNAQRRQGVEDVIKDSNMLVEYKRQTIPLKLANKTAELAQTYKRIADYCYKKYYMDSMTIYYKLALKEYEKLNDSFFIAYCYNRIGEELAYTRKNTEICLSWLFPAASYFERSGEYLMAAHTFYNISLAYKEVGPDSLRQKYLNKTIELNKHARDTLLEIIILLMQADELRKDEKWSQAHIKTTLAFDLCLLIKNDHFKKVSLVQLSEDYLNDRQPEKAILLLNESLNIKAKPRDMVAHIYWLLTQSHIQLNNKAEAEKYLVLYRYTSDSLAKQKEKEDYDELLVQYETEKKQATIDALERENKLRQKLEANQKILIVSLIAGLATVLVTGFIFYRNFRKRQKLEQKLGAQQDAFNLQLQEEREQKLTAEFSKQLAEVQLTALNAQMNPHFIFNCMNSIQKYILKNEKAKALEFLQNFSELMRSVLDNSVKTKVSLDEEINMLEKYILLEQQRLDNKFDYRIKVDPDLQTDFFEIPGMIIQPYVENAIWHGLMNMVESQNGLTKRSGMLTLGFSKENGTIKCVIEDNGVGRKKAAIIEKDKSPLRKSYGMAIAQKRFELLQKENEKLPEIQIDDLVSNGDSAGTRVTVYMNVD